IESKTHEIQAQAEEIKGINENLETLVRERTIELERKNKAIEEYAFINAHELRAPVASILGLIHLMQKLELNNDEKVYLEHLQQSAKKLDAVVGSITEAIERGDFKLPRDPKD
ncbi:MAG TPA: histidine kinase dimerization/phospho-acceptor domain-containing protein, partial [Cyclobacteriaceae bacterium]|nr:histidine kinase dimerization/phospho-acceptor domain-containing protein [Cyclobacteriaceae bacterium]